MRDTIKVGTCYAIPLSGRRYAYAQYIQWNKDDGYLVRIFDRITVGEILSAVELRGIEEMFPPVFVGLEATTSRRRWKAIGVLPVEELRFPTFRATSSTTPGKHNNWWLWDGKKEWFIGKLPPELRSLEIRGIWGDEILERRIETGVNPFADLE